MVKYETEKQPSNFGTAAIPKRIFFIKKQISFILNT